MSARAPEGPQAPWHTLSAEAVLARLATAEGGLSGEEAARRLREHGPNELVASRRTSPLHLLAAQFKNVLILILLIAVGLSAFLGHTLEAVVISVILLFAALLGFVQEYRAERAIEGLRRMAAPVATALRDGDEQDIAARELVPGDVVRLEAGARVPADARVLEAVNLKVEEAPLTGESQPVGKISELLAAADLAIGDRKNMVYAGTTVTYGRGSVIVVETGMRTEFGTIAGLLQGVESRCTPLQENLDRVGRVLAGAAVAVVAVILLLGILRGQPFWDMVIFGIALAVAVVPEALPAVVTISLALGAQRMVRRSALVRRLPAVETLGSVSVIASDKTGTLTRGEMTARRIHVAGRTLDVSGAGYERHGAFSDAGRSIAPPPPLMMLLQAAALASDAKLKRHGDAEGWSVKGDPTELALIVAAEKAGLHKQQLDFEFPRVAEIPFTSETKRMTTVHRTLQGDVAYSKGAPEVILHGCSRLLGEDGERALGAGDRELVLGTAREMASQALRVLAVAMKSRAGLEDAEREMTFLGLVGMSDPPRPEAARAIETCERAGIKAILITGDHALTAEAVARELGMLRQGRVVTGTGLDAMSDEDLEREVGEIEVYARVSPAHKLRVVTAWQRKGHYVAMTGDGVNDAPALKKADIGIAMGITGTDVSKDAAAMTLTDDNFASIVAAVEEGRGVFSNIKKYLMYLISSNVGEIGLMAGASVLGLPLPLTAVQILYVNLATDGLPALALAVDPPEADLMRRPPRDPRAGIFTRPVLTLTVLGGVWSMLVNIGLFAWALGSGRSVAEAVTMTFVSLVLIQFFKAYNFRSDRNSVLERPFANKWLNLAIAWEIAALAAILYVPVLNKPFGTFPLPLVDWVIVTAAAFTVSPVLEIAKWMERRGWFGSLAA
ncbi:MAG TPA: cation-translocating P-type ATPase [Thermoanaerobaculia bacterium]|nr:cation-translocating P-type ATPase [Thermoanaerobaculia bacterium]